MPVNTPGGERSPPVGMSSGMVTTSTISVGPGKVTVPGMSVQPGQVTVSASGIVMYGRAAGFMNPLPMTTPAQMSEHSPDLSSDGRFIVYETHPRR